MEEEKKYLNYQGLQTYHENLQAVLENSEKATAEALDDLDDRLKVIEDKGSYSKSEIDQLLTPINDKLENIEEFAEVNIQSDWNQTDTAADDYIKNKPTIPSVGNAEVEIQKNGTKVGSFTTNQSGSKVAVNITVPTGTAANKDVPTSGDASTSQVVMGDDSRLTDSRNAKDVYSWAKASSKPAYTASEVGAIPTSAKGAASGVATLDSTGKVPASQLPSYVDDVLEYDTKSAFPTTGEAGKIYVDKSNDTTWRWSGTTYTQIKGDLAIGTTTGTAADGGTASAHYSNTSNPHSVTKAQVGLGSVVNTGDSATPVSGGTTKFTTGGAYTELAKKVDKVSGKGLSTNDYTTDEKNKLSGIASGAQTNVIETVKVNGTALTPSSKAVNITVPTTTSELTNNSNFVSDASYVHTDNNYTATEKSKLSGIASGAEVNQNAFSNVGVKVGNTTTTVAADAKTDTVTLIQGSNVTLTADTTNDTITIAATDTTYSAATTSAAGLMSSDDKTKLNGIATGATKVTTDTVSGWGYTKNAGTVTGVKMNGTTKSPSSGVVDLGTVITSHQDISGKADKSATVSTVAYSTTDKKITKTINGTASDVVTAATIVTDGGGIKTITAAAGSNIGSVGTPSVTASTSGTSTTLTFNYLKGAKGDTGSNGTNGTNGTSAYWFSGTAVTGTGTGISVSVSGSKAGDMYLNTSNSNVYKATAANTWSYVCNIKGATGSNGSNGAAAGFGTPTATVDANVGTPSVTVSASGADTAKVFAFTFKNLKGQPGTNGTNGTNGTSAYWFSGTAVTGTNTSGISASVSGSKAGDMYLNTSTYNVYKATAANTWGYICNIKGTNATTTSVFDTSNNGLAPSASSGNKTTAESKVGNYYLCADAKYRQLPANAFKDTTYSSQSALSDSTDVSLCTRGEKYTWNNKQTQVAKLGSTTKPVYTSAAGTFAECSTYAGGTAVTLNGTSKAASTASLYAPTEAGTSGQVLISSGSGAPSWGAPSYANVSYGVNTANVSGAVSIDGRTPLHILTVTANVSSVALSYNPAAGHTCHVIFKAASAMTVVMAYDAMNRVTPDGGNVNLSIPAGGYVELNFLSDGTKVYVRGI